MDDRRSGDLGGERTPPAGAGVGEVTVDAGLDGGSGGGGIDILSVVEAVRDGLEYSKDRVDDWTRRVQAREGCIVANLSRPTTSIQIMSLVVHCHTRRYRLL